VRVVMVSKALAVGAYQRKLEEIARLPGVELTAIVPSDWRDRRGHVSLERAHVSGYELIAAPLRLNGQYHLHFYPTLGRLLNQLRPDILHMDEEPYNLATWHALRLGQAVGARSLFFTWQNLNRRYPWPFRAFEVANYRRAAYAIAGNRAAVDVLRGKGYRGPVAVIPQFGVATEIFRPRAIDDRPSTIANRPSSVVRRPSSFVIGYAGVLIPEKGVDLLLRACAGLPDVGWRLAIVGDGPERAQLGALAGTLGIGDRVDFLGQRASTQMPDVYPDFDVLVLPSLTRPNWKEQFGRVLIEAMACGVPVIGSDSGEIPNVIGDAGLIFPEGDIDALRDSIASLLTDPEQRAQYAEAGRSRVLAEFTQAQIAAATHRVYCEILLQQETT
jgi:glycosyltransferase involved in cell wall biosynthesis